MIEQAKGWGDVVIILNSDAWLMMKKGYVFMTWEQRCEILDALESVHLVMGADDSDGTVCSTLRLLRPDYFGNGGDRVESNTPEHELCQELGIETLYKLGGGKIESSSHLIDRIITSLHNQ
jgi:D-beta-D-heptose 7-phosphate kinase/D-beta-D-heptose 1-phosphate adenosyltransferase